ncbi:MAG: hypothetical protein ACYC54_05915 [Sedimentisphaerales bacterium]
MEKFNENEEQQKEDDIRRIEELLHSDCFKPEDISLLAVQIEKHGKDFITLAQQIFLELKRKCPKDATVKLYRHKILCTHWAIYEKNGSIVKACPIELLYPETGNPEMLSLEPTTEHNNYLITVRDKLVVVFE